MPTTYTHYYFGKECIKTLPKDLQLVIERNRELFDIGVHGPDIFFYYHFFIKNKVHMYGSNMHFKPAKGFFNRCKKVYKKTPVNDQEALLSYILGFLSHFALDSTCHGYVDRKFEVDGPSHNLIEAQYDAHLMRRNHLKPIKVKRYKVVTPSKESSRIIAKVHPFRPWVVYSSLLQQRFVLWGLHSPLEIKKKFILFVLKLLHMNPELGDLRIDNEEYSSCKDSNLRLDKLKDLALKRYPELVQNWLDCLEYNTPLPDYFEHDFEPWSDYKEIPILSYKEELKYEV